MIEAEINEDALFARLTQRWLSDDGTAAAKPDPEVERIRDKLAGPVFSKRLASAERGGFKRPVRYTKPLYKVEYYLVQGDPNRPYLCGGWTVEVLENGRRIRERTELTDEECLRQIELAERKGIPIKRIVMGDEAKQGITERSRPIVFKEPVLPEKKPVSGRKAMLTIIGDML